MDYSLDMYLKSVAVFVAITYGLLAAGKFAFGIVPISEYKKVREKLIKDLHKSDQFKRWE